MFVNNINPILFEWGFISIRWYGVFLGIGVGLAILVAVKLFKQNHIPIDLVFTSASYLIIAGLIGARLGYILFYQPLFYFNNPKEIIFINHGGLSSHGMTLGLIAVFFLLFKLKRINKKIIDLLIIPIPIIAVFIRLGNFFNNEILGRTTNLPWAVDGRHPVQIYELIICFIIFIALYFIYRKLGKKLPVLFITCFFIFLYFSTRFIIELFKEFQILSSDNIFTMGQYLSIPFIIWSVIWLIQIFLKQRKTSSLS